MKERFAHLTLNLVRNSDSEFTGWNCKREIGKIHSTEQWSLAPYLTPIGLRCFAPLTTSSFTLSLTLIPSRLKKEGKAQSPIYSGTDLDPETERQGETRKRLNSITTSPIYCKAYEILLSLLAFTPAPSPAQSLLHAGLSEFTVFVWRETDSGWMSRMELLNKVKWRTWLELSYFFLIFKWKINDPCTVTFPYFFFHIVRLPLFFRPFIELGFH